MCIGIMALNISLYMEKGKKKKDRERELKRRRKGYIVQSAQVCIGYK